MLKRIGSFGSVTVFGGATMDRIARTKLPPTLGFSNPGAVRSLPGGVGFNVALALARLKLPVRLVAAVGADADGAAVLELARSSGIDTSSVLVSSAAPTATYQATFDDKGSLIVGVADMSVYEELVPAAVSRAAALAPRNDLWVIDANLRPDTLDFIVYEAEATQRPVAALTVSPAKAVRLGPVLDRTSLLFTNRREAMAIVGADDGDKAQTPAALAAAISRDLTPNVVVTNAAEPIAVATSGEVRSFATLKATVRSVNGAGDALAAGTIFALADGRPLTDAIRSGLAAAAITVESDGILHASLSAPEVSERIASGARRLSS